MSHRIERKPIRVSLTLDAALANILTVAAKAAGETVSDVVRESVEYYLTLDVGRPVSASRNWSQSPTSPGVSLSWSRTIPFSTPPSTEPSNDRHDDEPVRTRISFAVTPGNPVSGSSSALRKNDEACPRPAGTPSSGTSGTSAAGRSQRQPRPFPVLR